MNSTTFLFSGGLGFAVGALGCCVALAYAALGAANIRRLGRGCAMAWAFFGLVLLCLVITFKVSYPGLETAPRLAQWQIGASLAAGALMLRVSLLRVNQLQAAQAQGERHTASGLVRSIRLHLAATAALLAFAAVAGWRAAM